MTEENILSAFGGDSVLVLTLDEVFVRASVTPEKSKAARRILKSLVRRGVLERGRGRRYRLAGNETDSQAPGAADQARDRGDGPSGGPHLGLFREVGKSCFVHVDVPPRGSGVAGRAQTRAVADIMIPRDDALGAKDGDLVRVEVTRSSTHVSMALGRVIEVLGKPGQRRTEIKKLMIEHHLDPQFPSEAQREAESFGGVISEAEIRGRVDLRDLPLVTIDSETARDFDDAVCAERFGAEAFKLTVAIADVSHYVRERTALDQEARRRTSSTYLTDRAIPMLPEALSNELCSLKPNVDRLCVVAEIVIDRVGRMEKVSFHRAVMRSRARLTYTRVTRALEGDPDDECRLLLPSLLRLSKVAALLLERRLKRGSIDLDLPEPEVIFNEEGHPVNVVKRARTDAHRLIEDLMLAANEAVATDFSNRKGATIFRIHEAPDPDKMQAFASLCETLALSVRLKRHPRPAEVALALTAISEHPTGKWLHYALLRSLNQAKYDADCKGHFGLATERYLHFTSPIRRYPDLVVHRMLTAHLEARAHPHHAHELSEIAKECSDGERRAVNAERASLDLDRALVAQEHMGEPLSGTITGVQNFGLFVSISDPFVEGLVPIQGLGDDYWQMDEYGAALRGRHSGHEFKMGAAIDVEIAAVNIDRRQIELRLLAPPEIEGGRPAQRNQRPRGNVEKTRKAEKPTKPTKPTKTTKAKRRGKRRA